MTKVFKIGDKQYECFLADDKHIEIYEKHDPREGMIFDNKKSLISFVNNLSDIIEEGL